MLQQVKGKCQHGSVKGVHLHETTVCLNECIFWHLKLSEPLYF